MHILVEHRVPLILWSTYQYVAVLVLLHVVHIRAYLYMKYMYSRSSYVLFVTCNVYMYIVKLVEHRVRVFLWSTYQYVPVAVLAEPVDDLKSSYVHVLFVTCNVYMYIVKLVEHRVRVFLWSTYQYVPVAVLAEPVDDQAAGHKVPWPPAHKVPWPPAHKVPCYSIDVPGG